MYRLLMGSCHSFEQSAFLSKKLAYHWLLVIGKPVQICMFSSNSDGWRLAMQTYFSLKIQHIPQSDLLVTWILLDAAN